MELKVLGYSGEDTLYQHPLYGASTKARIAEMDALRKVARPVVRISLEVQCSEELSVRNERCIDEHGCGIF